jgi:UDP-N-acetyl-D-mannosaminuronic acid transferase (WecB/TagA/CpsF family)
MAGKENERKTRPSIRYRMLVEWISSEVEDVLAFLGIELATHAHKNPRFGSDIPRTRTITIESKGVDLVSRNQLSQKSRKGLKRYLDLGGGVLVA